MGMDNLIHNIPLDRLDNYRKRLIVLRSENVKEITDALHEVDRRNVVSVQIVSPTGNPDPSFMDFFSIPVDLLLVNVEEEYPILYQWAGLPAKGPARVSIPVVAGFGKALKLQPKQQDPDAAVAAPPGPPCSSAIIRSELTTRRGHDVRPVWQTMNSNDSRPCWAPSRAAFPVAATMG
jgi:hypothetical protein